MLPILGPVEVRRAGEVRRSAMQHAVVSRPAPCIRSRVRGRFSTGLDCSGAQCALAARLDFAVRARIRDRGVRNALAGCARECGPLASSEQRCVTTPARLHENGHQSRIAAGACRIRMQATPCPRAWLPVTHNTVTTLPVAPHVHVLPLADCPGTCQGTPIAWLFHARSCWCPPVPGRGREGCR